MLRLGRVPANARHVIISLNPNAGAKSGRPMVDELAEHLSEKGFVCRIESDIEQVAELARRWLADGSLRAVVSAGGDGTASLVTNKTPIGTPILVFPLGTENLLAKHLDCRGGVDQAVEVLEAGRTLQMDAGRANDRLFLLMLGCGFDANVVHRVHSKRKGHIRRWTYFKPILRAMRRYRYPELRLACQVQSEHSNEKVETVLNAKWAFVVNLPRYAGGLRVAPDANGHDGWLDLCTFKQGKLLRGLWYVAGIIFRFHKSLRDCRMMQVTRVRIESDEEVHYQLDGDPGGTLPVDIEVLPKRVTLLVDPRWAKRQGFQDDE